MNPLLLQEDQMKFRYMKIQMILMKKVMLNTENLLNSNPYNILLSIRDDSDISDDDIQISQLRYSKKKKYLTEKDFPNDLKYLFSRVKA